MVLYIFIILNLIGSDPSIYDYQIRELDSDRIIRISDFKGKKILFVNVASKCGYTPQYKDLQNLATQFKDQLIILGLPCDQFLGQEFNEEGQIRDFCTDSYSVTFPMTTVVDVKGSNQHPIYTWLTRKELNDLGDFKVSWNFNKFLVDETGKLLAYFPSDVEPLDEEIVNYLK